MPTFRTGTVVEIIAERPGLQRCRVDIDGEIARAYCLTDLVGDVAIGDEVVCNTTAVELGLGTGGWHVVHWNLSRRTFERQGPDHIMKLRYTSLQFDAGTSELLHPDLPTSLGGVPVVVCQVHSQVGVVAAVIKSLRPSARIAYVMTDGASLPMVMSDLIAQLTADGTISATVTAGHAFGGGHEAVNVHSGLLLAAHVASADVIILGMGPGVVGTGTKFGTTAIEAASALDAVRALEGLPILCLRVSSGDRRTRHLGISHHSRTVVGLTMAAPLVAEFPSGLAADLGAERAGRVRIERVDLPAVASILEDAGLQITTMGRDISQDRDFFDAAAAAAALAVQSLPVR